MPRHSTDHNDRRRDRRSHQHPVQSSHRRRRPAATKKPTGTSCIRLPAFVTALVAVTLLSFAITLTLRRWRMPPRVVVPGWFRNAALDQAHSHNDVRNISGLPAHHPVHHHVRRHQDDGSHRVPHGHTRSISTRLAQRAQFWRRRHHLISADSSVDAGAAAVAASRTPLAVSGAVGAAQPAAQQWTHVGASAGRRNVVRDHVGRIVEAAPAGGHAGGDDGHDDTSVGTDGISVASAVRVATLAAEAAAAFGHGSAGGGNGTAGAAEEEEEEEEVAEEFDSDDSSADNSTSSAVGAGGAAKPRSNEYMGSTGGAADGIVRGHNVTRVSHTVYKILKLFGFSSLTDSPAGAHAEWMGDMGRRMAFEQPMFRYVGVDATEEGLAKARASLGDAVDAEYEIRDVEREMCNATDVVLHWTELDGSPSDPRSNGYLDHVRKVMRAAKLKDHGYIIFGQYPRLKGPMPTYKQGKWVFLDQRKEDPFLFNDHVRGVVPMVGGSQAYVMYLTFYSLRSIPLSELAV